MKGKKTSPSLCLAVCHRVDVMEPSFAEMNENRGLVATSHRAQECFQLYLVNICQRKPCASEAVCASTLGAADTAGS